MKKYFLLYKIMLLGFSGLAQVTVDNGASMISSGNVSVVLDDINLVNNGNISGGAGSFRFTGLANSYINGNSLPSFNILEMAKTGANKLLLNQNIQVGYSINFVSGLLDLNNNNITLSSTAFLSGESETSRIVGVSGGYVQITQNLNAPSQVNPGNLGATITSNADLGLTIIRRRHTELSGGVLTKSILRSFDIIPTNNTNLDAGLRINYFDAELNGLTENLGIYQYNPINNLFPWTNYHLISTNSTLNFVEQVGFGSLMLQTLGDNGGEILSKMANTNLAKPKSNNTSMLMKKITIGPNPNNGNFWFSVNGLERETIATLYNIDGKQVKQFRIANLQQQQVNSMRSGIYILKVPGFDAQKIIVNGSGMQGTTSGTYNKY